MATDDSSTSDDDSMALEILEDFFHGEPRTDYACCLRYHVLHACTALEQITFYMCIYTYIM